MTDNTQSFNHSDIPDAEPDADNLVDLPLLLLDEQVASPVTLSNLIVSGAANMQVLQVAMANQQTLMAIRQRPDAPEDAPLFNRLAAMGTEIVVQRSRIYGQDRRVLMVSGRRRLEPMEIIQMEPYPVVRAAIAYDHIGDEDHLLDYRERIIFLFENMLDIDAGLDDDLVEYIFLIDDESELVDMLWAVIGLAADERQRLLNELDVVARMRYMIELLEKEIETMAVMEDVNSQVQDDIARAHREFLLREQMRVIQTELGEEDYFQQELTDLRQKLDDAGLPEEIHRQAHDELRRLNMMMPGSAEATVSRTYLDWILVLPWATPKRSRVNFTQAEKTLNRDHYGLDKVKERILEHLAVRKLARDRMQTPILCFVGPPGAGKTSIGRSIAQALGRPFVRVSLGGVRDEAEIRGHRRTYVGAMPGRIIQTMKRAGARNPVFMLDEIDKLSMDYRGDPASALLEVLDPEQNHEFVDHYLEVPYDLSQVLFITTANDLYPLPEALEDRLEIIEFRAYTEEEKLEIARRFLIPKQLEGHGIKKRGITFQQNALQTIIRDYTLEAGVRNLEREIAAVCRKLARRIAAGKSHPKRITDSLVRKYLGPPYIFHTRVNTEDSVGLVTGLVWTSGGGDIQSIEASLLPGKGNLTLTGSLGDVLQESAQTALSYMRSRARDLDVSHDDFDNYDVHIHMPEGAVPKDGPSAGITLATAIISVFTEQPVRSDIAMTGELTLRGYVLPIGGVKEKVLAARRHRIQTVILPADNEKDLEDIPKPVLRDMTFIFVETMQQVMDAVLLDPPEQRQRDLDEAEDDEDERD